MLYRNPFTEPPLRDYLERYYRNEGGAVEFEYLDAAQFVLEECQDCGLIFQKEVPNDLMNRRIWEHWIDPAGAHHRFVMNVPFDSYAAYAQEIMMTLAYLAETPGFRRPARVLDFGMGWGVWCQMAEGFGCDVYGTEILQTRIAHARSRGLRVIDPADVPNHTFDFINSEQVFEHLAGPLDTLEWLTRALNPVGLIKISVPDARDLKRRLRIMDWTAPYGSRNSLNDTIPLIHVNSFTHRSLVRMAELAGLELVKIPLRLQYIYGTNWRPVVPLLKRLARPLYRNLLGRGTYLFFRHARRRAIALAAGWTSGLSRERSSGGRGQPARVSSPTTWKAISTT